MSLDLELVEPGAITFGSCGVSAPPLHMISEQGEHSGYEPAVARALCDRLGVDLRWKTLEWPDLYPALDARQADAILYNQAITAERKEQVDFTVPYGVFAECIFVQASSPITKPADLAQRTVAAIEGTTNEELALAFADATYVSYPASLEGFYSMLDDLKAGRIDALVDDELVLRTLASSDYRIAFSVPTDNPYGIAIGHRSTAVFKALNGALRDLIEDGTLQKIWNAHLPPELFVRPDNCPPVPSLQELLARVEVAGGELA